MEKPVVSGLLSYGMSGKIFHAPFLADHPGFTFRAVVERHTKAAREQYPTVLSYDHPEQLLEDAQIELIVVNTPNDTHYTFAREALLAGKHVLIEKPATVSSAEARELFALGRQLGLKVMVYHNRRFNSDFLSFREVIAGGSLGQLSEVHLRIGRYRLDIGKKVFKESAAVPGNGLMYDLGSHLLDGAISLFGKPLSFTKTTASHRPGSAVDDYFHFHLSYPGQLQVFLSSSLLVAAPEAGFVAHGTHGSFLKFCTDVQEGQLAAGMMPSQQGFGKEPAGSEGRLVLVGTTSERSEQKVVAPHGAYSHFYQQVYQTLRYHKPFPVTEEQVIWQLEMLES